MYKESVNFPIGFQEKSDCLADVVALSANQRAHQTVLTQVDWPPW